MIYLTILPGYGQLKAQLYEPVPEHISRSSEVWFDNAAVRLAE